MVQTLKRNTLIRELYIENKTNALLFAFLLAVFFIVVNTLPVRATMTMQEDVVATGIQFGPRMSIAVDSNNQAHMSAALTTGGLSYFTRSNGIWTSEVIDAIGRCSTILLGSDGQPRVIYASDNGITCARRLVSGSWSKSVIDTSFGWPHWAAMGPDGRVHVVYSKDSSYDLYYAVSDVNNSTWTYELIESGGTYIIPWIGFDGNGLVILYSDVNGTTIKLARKSQGVWNKYNLYTCSTESIIRWCSAAFDTQTNKIKVAFMEFNFTSTTAILHWGSLDGNVLTLESSDQNTLWIESNLPIAISNGSVLAAGLKSSKYIIKACDGSKSVNLNTLPFSSGGISLTTGFDGKVYAAFISNDNKLICASEIVDKSILSSAICEANSLKSSKTIGTAPGNVPQAAYQTFVQAITTAEGVYNDSSATEATVNQQVSLLSSAKLAFNAAIIPIPTAVPTVTMPVKAGDSIISGTAEANSVIIIKRGVVTIGTGSANASGTYTVPLNTGQTLAVNDYLSVTATAPGKTESSPANVTVQATQTLASLGGVALNAFAAQTDTTPIDFSSLAVGSKFFVRLGVNAAYVKGLDFGIEYSGNLKVAEVNNLGSLTPIHGIWGLEPLNSANNYLAVGPSLDSTNRKINFAFTMLKLLNTNGVYDFGTRDIYYIQFEVINAGNSYVKLYAPSSHASVTGSQGIVYMDKDNALHAVPATAINNRMTSFTIGTAQSATAVPTVTMPVKAGVTSISGTAEANSAISIRRGTGIIGTGSATAAGVYTANLNAAVTLAVGDVLTVTATAPDKTESSAASVTVTEATSGIIKGSLNGRITIPTTIAGTYANLSGVTVTVVGTSYTTTSQNDGTFNFADVPTGTYSIKFEKSKYISITLTNVSITQGVNSLNNDVKTTLIGDADLNGSVTAADASTIFAYLKGQIASLQNLAQMAADTDSTVGITAADASTIFAYLKGQITDFVAK